MARHLRIWLACVLAALAAIGAGAPARGAASPPQPSPAPVLAYYYIWYNASSWNRAKTDYPLVGRYSSDERSVMDRHVRWAQQAGISGFIVSWKSTPLLDDRLQMLIDVATQRRFRLEIIYQGLDFHRRPQDPARVKSDFELFARKFAPAAPFHRNGPPTVIWSGTWRFTPDEVAGVTSALRPAVTVLATEKTLRGIRRLARAVDGDAYYWSSADPLRTPGHVRKLVAMGRAVHRAGGVWIAPATAGFDARLVGGRKTVPRRSGATLRASLDAATASSPDAIGLVSWNEYSENSHIEPSRQYGYQELRTLADVLGSHAEISPTAELDSSSSSSPTGTRHALPLLAGLIAVLLGGALVARRRRAGYRRGVLPPAPLHVHSKEPPR
jgi:hypothetical protein